MTRPGPDRTDKFGSYRSLSNFYLADARRIASPERDLGLWWRAGAHGPLHRAAWVRDTGELYVVRLGPAQDGTGSVEVLGRARDRNELERALVGWRDVCPQPDSMTWLRHRAQNLPQPEMPRRLSRDLTHIAMTGHRLQRAKASFAHRRGLTHDALPHRLTARQLAMSEQGHRPAAVRSAKRTATATPSVGETSLTPMSLARPHAHTQLLVAAGVAAGLAAPAAAALLELAVG